MVNHGQRYCSWARTHDGDDNDDDDDDDGGVAQDGGHKGTSKPKRRLNFSRAFWSSTRLHNMLGQLEE